MRVEYLRNHDDIEDFLINLSALEPRSAPDCLFEFRPGKQVP